MEVAMNEFHVTLTEDEHRLLTEILGQVLKEKRVEEHRTRTSSFREIVIAEEELIEGMLLKLNQVAAV
jgi:hypothetical protein